MAEDMAINNVDIVTTQISHPSTRDKKDNSKCKCTSY